MNITMENVDKVSAKITLKIEKADYEEALNKQLKDMRKKVQMPGFRPGQVPMGLITKRFGQEALAETINKMLGEKLYGYIQENKLEVLGEPLPAENEAPLDFQIGNDFTFAFDVALAPELNTTLNKKNTVPYYKITVDDKMIDGQVNMYAQRGGAYEKVDSYEAKDMVKGLLAELDAEGNTLEGGIQVEGAIIMPEYVKNEEQKALFAGCKVNDVLVINPSKAYEGKDAEIASLLKIKKEEVGEHTNDFSFQVEEITRFTPATVDQKLFDQVMGEGTCKDEAEFRAKVKEQLEAGFVADQDYKFMVDVRTMMVEKNKEVAMADSILKRIMALNAKDKTEGYVEENYDKSIEELKWHLVKEALVKQHEIKLEDGDLMNIAKDATRAQFSQYGMCNIPEDIIEKYAGEMLKNREQVQQLADRAIESKLSVILKETVKISEKEVTVEEFQKLFA